jgi:DNA-binding CsgD family transcriptional regulator
MTEPRFTVNPRNTDSPDTVTAAAPRADAPQVARWFQQCERFAQSQDMPLFLFGLSMPRPGREAVEFLVTNYPAEWLQIYDSSDYIHIDPVAARLMRSSTPFAWDELHPGGGARVAAFWKRAEHYALRHGYTIPLHGPRGQRAAFALSGLRQPLPQDQREDRFARAWMFSVHLLEDMLREYERQEHIPADGRLTPQQKEALALVAQGLSVRAIADALARHPRTVEYHLHGALRRLGATSREQAIVRAMLVGEIETAQLPNKLRDWQRPTRLD